MLFTAFRHSRRSPVSNRTLTSTSFSSFSQRLIDLFARLTLDLDTLFVVVVLPLCILIFQHRHRLTGWHVVCQGSFALSFVCLSFLLTKWAATMSLLLSRENADEVRFCISSCPSFFLIAISFDSFPSFPCFFPLPFPSFSPGFFHPSRLFLLFAEEKEREQKTTKEDRGRDGEGKQKAEGRRRKQQEQEQAFPLFHARASVPSPCAVSWNHAWRNGIKEEKKGKEIVSQSEEGVKGTTVIKKQEEETVITLFS